jgi:Zn-finger nucleic acid-binding protein
MYIKCPVCQVVMNRKLFAAGSGVVVDICRDHGAFFDTGELPRIIEYVMQGGLEKAARKEIDEQRAQAQREMHAARAAAAASAQMPAMGWSSHRHRHDAGHALVDLLSALFR